MVRGKLKYIILIGVTVFCICTFIVIPTSNPLHSAHVTLRNKKYGNGVQDRMSADGAIYLADENKPTRSGPSSRTFFQQALDAVTQSSLNSSHYLDLVNTLHEEFSMAAVSDVTKRKLEAVVRSGQGLKPYMPAASEAGWDENGMLYRRWVKPDPSTMHPVYPSPYFSEYEVFMPFNEDTFFEGRQPDVTYKTSRKVILWHTKTRYTARINDLQPLKACPDFPCYITTNKKYSKTSSAMIFTAQILKDAPPRRTPEQTFVLHNHEPPFTNAFFMKSWQNGFLQPAWKRAFNWTMTYRMDSDFVVPYGVVRKRPTPLVDKDYEGIVRQKTKLAAWLVSNCRTSSEREKYVKELQKHVQIDVYGKCGNHTCPHMEDGKCSKMITDTYKFYLSFESAFCPDYISEKFFHYLTMDTIVIARGSNQYFQHAPREIFLNTADFPSPKELADRMLFLHQHEDAYIKLLKEKDKYMSCVEGYPVRNPDGYIRFMAYRFEARGVCHLCQRLWNIDKYAKSIPDIHEWFGKKVCRKADDLNFGNNTE